ncbi:hypothetical protein NLI96_g6676 [Meripilus lineatus]|uniref:BTB domain-containing protein n=1 Tax=Meripilus lineatus TaxID=2056292 RepID=A0AAD5V0G1_9APHY|nr:hypothetical protein NLI96_g6676 [Physisporinus lineatus]
MASIAASESPFDENKSSDVIIRTQDGVKFYVHRFILSLVSPFFSQMFNLDQSPSTDNEPQEQPVVDVSESSRVIDTILRMCYPVAEPELSSLPSLVDCLVATSKYEMDFVMRKLKRPLRNFLKSVPLRVYALACQYALEDIAKEATPKWRHQITSSLNKALMDTHWSGTVAGRCYTEEMKDISSGMYYRLLQYMSSGKLPRSFTKPYNSQPVVSNHLEDYDREPHLRLGSATDVFLVSIDGVKLPAHQAIIWAASVTFEELLHSTESPEGLPEIHLPYAADILVVVLHACYPGGMMLDNRLTLPDLAHLLSAAKEFELCVLEEMVKQRLLGFVKSDPLELYFRAASLGWEEGAREAAMQTCRLSDHLPYAPVMETMPARYYHSLLKFRHRCRSALAGCVQAVVSQDDKGDILDGKLWTGWLRDELEGTAPELVLAIAATAPPNAESYEALRRSNPSPWGQTSTNPPMPKPSQRLVAFGALEKEIKSAYAKVSTTSDARRHLFTQTKVELKLT